uniref:uncharacterized protein LOC120338310 n=1 Tax=Styela clava TaxID=7725 RepID=UPI0019395E56|nr:uncharacterized protein LOC120338310 [Styela clava]
MASFSRQRVLPVTSGDNTPQVESKYFCEASNNQVNIYLELKSPARIGVKNPLCFILVIDASGSMSNPVGNDSTSLFDRMKTFAHMMIEHVSSDDYLAIISFAEDARVDLGITKMDDHGKNLAKKTLPLLNLRGTTNLEDGLTKALEEIKWARSHFWKEGNVRSNIILFTDGLPNRGIRDAQRLIAKYKEIEKSMSGGSRVPLSAFTIGNYRPEVLVEIASKLSSEAFYWLDQNQNFESDMMIPLFLKKMTHVSDVRVKLQSGCDVYFSPTKTSKDHLEEQTFDNLTYFLHSLPEDMPKTISIYLEIRPGLLLSMLHGQTILSAHISYLDENLKMVEFQDVITFSQSTLFEIMTKTFVPSEIQAIDAETQSYARSSYLFTSGVSQTQETWTEAKQSLLKYVQMACLNDTANVILAAQNHARDVNEMAESTLLLFEKHTQRFGKIVRNDQLALRGLNIYLSQLKSHVDTAREAVIVENGSNFSQMAAIVSALKNETPGVGVSGLREKHKIDTKLNDLRQILSDAKSHLRKTLPTKGSHNYSRMAEVLSAIYGEQTECAHNDKNENEVMKTWIFEDIYFVLAESYTDRNKLESTIQNLGGTFGDKIIGGNARTIYVICSKEGPHNTTIITEAQQKGIPIVHEKYVEECERENELLAWFKFALKSQ